MAQSVFDKYYQADKLPRVNLLNVDQTPSTTVVTRNEDTFLKLGGTQIRNGLVNSRKAGSILFRKRTGTGALATVHTITFTYTGSNVNPDTIKAIVP